MTSDYLQNKFIDSKDNNERLTSLCNSKTTNDIEHMIAYLPIGDNETEDNYRRSLFRKWDINRDQELSISQVFIGLIEHLNPKDRSELKEIVTNAFNNISRN